ncbi:MAG: DUF4261 domain-containing protein [Pirellulales bacterium]
MNMQIVELHFSTEPKCDYSTIKSRAEEILGEPLDSPDLNSTKDTLLLFHASHLVQLKDAVIAPQTALLRVDKSIQMEEYSDVIQQSWGFKDCSSVLSQSKHTMLVIEMMALSLSPVDRIHLFHGVLQAVIELLSPIALVFKHSQQAVHPQAYLANVALPPILRPGSLNVRFFNISNSDGDMLMDTRGLSDLGLHDLQCHFRELDPNEVGKLLFNTGVYIFENGPVVESGNTVAGIEEGQRWKCQFENSLASPDREVLDLDPGPPYAAGGRT